MTEAEKFVPIRKLAESGFLTESRLRKMHKQGKLPGIWCGKKFLVNVPLLNTSCGISAALARCALSVLATAGWSIWTALPPTSTRATIQRSWKAVTGKAEWDVRAKESCPAGSPRHQIKKKNALCRLVTRCCLIGVLLLYPWGPDISTFSRQMNQAGNALFSFRHQKWRH